MAMGFGKRGVFLSEGQLAQTASRAELYSQPKTIKVARFLGFQPIDLVCAENLGNLFFFGAASETCQIGIRPEKNQLVTHPVWLFKILWFQETGPAYYAKVRVENLSLLGRC